MKSYENPKCDHIPKHHFERIPCRTACFHVCRRDDIYIYILLIARILHLQQDMVQFLCLSDDTETEAEDVTMSYLFQACDESSSESGSSGSSSEKKKKKKKKGKA